MEEDPFLSLEKDDDPAVIAWTRERDTRARDALARLPTREAFAKSIRQLDAEPGVAAHVVLGGTAFQLRRERVAPGAERLVRIERNRREKPLLPTYTRGFRGIHEDARAGRVLVEGRAGPDDETDLFVLNSQGDVVEELHEQLELSLAVSGDGRGFYYRHAPMDAQLNNRWKGVALRFHEYGTPFEHDKLVSPPPPPGQYETLVTNPPHANEALVRSGRSTSEVFMRRRRGEAWSKLPTNPSGFFDGVIASGKTFVFARDEERPSVYQVLEQGTEYSLRRVRASEGEKRIVAVHSSGASLMVVYLVNGRHEIEWLNPGTLQPISVSLPFSGSIYDVLPRGDGGLCLTVESWSRPPVLMEIEANGLELKPLTRAKPKGSSIVDAIDLVDERYEAKSSDGTMVPYTLLRSKRSPSGPKPTILYAYGAYGISSLPGYIERALAWAERGGIFVLAHVRGGGERGPAWYEGGRGPNKRNGIADYLAVMQDLVDRGFTLRGTAVANTGSMGGILVGTAVIDNPRLFAGAILAAPVTDGVRHHHFGANVELELGNPDNPEELKFILDASPYHRIQKGTRYSPFLLLSSHKDGRAGSAHSRKFAAALEAAHPKNEVYLRTDWEGGHFLPLDEEQRTYRQADALAFAWDVAHREVKTPTDASRSSSK